jgi:hypothetical protein
MFYKKDISPEVPSKIRLAPDLAAYALRSKESKTIYLYFVLRSFNSDAGLGPWGSGILPLDSTIDALVKYYGYSRRTLERDLYGKGSSKFWTISDDKIHLKGIRKIYHDLDIKATDRHFREVSDASQFNTAKKRKAQLYASLFTPNGRKGKPITRAWITERTGLAKIQQRRYEQEARVHRTPTYADFHDANGKVQPFKIEVKSVSKKNGTVKTYLVNNIYNTRQLPACKGILKQCKRSSNWGGTFADVRVFFTGVRHLIKALVKRRGVYGYYLLRPQARRKQARLEWCLEMV